MLWLGSAIAASSQAKFRQARIGPAMELLERIGAKAKKGLRMGMQAAGSVVVADGGREKHSTSDPRRD